MAPHGGPAEPLGIVYAVNYLLETRLGVRHWAPGAFPVPQTETVAVPADLAITQNPLARIGCPGGRIIAIVHNLFQPRLRPARERFTPLPVPR